MRPLIAWLHWASAVAAPAPTPLSRDGPQPPFLPRGLRAPRNPDGRAAGATERDGQATAGALEQAKASTRGPRRPILAGAAGLACPAPWDARRAGQGKAKGGAVADTKGLLVVREDTIIKGEVRNCRQIEV